MFLSKLIVNSRSVNTRQLLASPYLLHKAICRAFPDAGEGGTGRVLFRLDEEPYSENIYLLVQSEKEPCWEKAALLNKRLVGSPQYKKVELHVKEGQTLYFRLRANPTIKREGKRLGILHEDSQIAWLRRKAKDSGFSVNSCTVIPEGIVKDKKAELSANSFNISFISVRFEGVLKVDDASIFTNTVSQGIGSGKAMGFGLLSIAPSKG